MLVRAKYSIQPVCLNKVKGKPFTVEEIAKAIRNAIEDT